MTLDSLGDQIGAGRIAALPAGVKLVQLDNGLILIIREDHSAAVVSAQAWCQTGSIHENQWLGSGVSHVLEHMLFKGTTTRGPGRIDQEVQDAGGYMNAYTSFDRTVYYINVPQSGARTAVDILCDIMQNATLPPEELEKEKQVILREMDMNQDDPARRSSRRLFETAYTVSPHRHTVIGYPDIYHELKSADIQAYYRERYAPNNVFLVVVGDIRAEDVETQVREAFAQTRARPLTPLYLPVEPAQMAERQVLEEAPIEVSHFHFSWHIPDLRHPDAPILDVLSTLLGAGRSARLYQQVREKAGLVHSVDAWTYSPGAPGLIGLSAMTEAHHFDAACRAMLAEVERMKAEPVDAAELDKAVKQFTAATLATRKTMQGQAQDFGGNWIAAHDLNFSERYLAAVRKITPDDLLRVVRQYLTTENRTLYALLPQGAGPKAEVTRETNLNHPVQRHVLANGLKLLVKEDHRLPFVEFRVVFKGGVIAETEANNGQTLLLSKMLLKGTHRRSAETIAREIESVGGSIDSYGGNNSLGLSLEVMSSDFSIGWDLLLDVLFNPSFPEDALALEREMQMATIKAMRDQVLQCASQSMRRALFGTSGYGLDLHGTESSIPAVSVPALQAAHQRLVAPNNCVLAIFGDINSDQITKLVERSVSDWRARDQSFAALSSVLRLNEVSRTDEVRDKKQAVVLIGYPGTTIYQADRFPLELLQEACSDLGSRLFLRIREKLGIAYYVGAQNFLGLSPGFFAFYAGTSPENASVVEQEMLREAAILSTEGLGADELQRAKAKLLGHKKIARQDLGNFAMTSALDELYGLGYDNTDKEDACYESVTLSDIQAVANKTFQPNACVISVVRSAMPTDAVDTGQQP
jgi:zinc protease